MQYLLLIYNNESTASAPATPEFGAIMKEYGDFTRSIMESGHYKGGNALQPVSTATSVRVRDGKTLLTDGPFAETAEQLGGYYLVEAANLDDATAIAARIPGGRWGTDRSPAHLVDGPARLIMDPRLSAQIEGIYTDERDRILATLIGMLRNFDLAEEMLQEAFGAALVQWRESGIPANPRAWIIGTARHKALDRLRRDAAFRERFPELQRSVGQAGQEGITPMPELDGSIADDRLRLIFTCCHPALATEAQVALTLRTLCGLTTDEIARTFLVSPQTMAQRLVRVQRKITDAGIPYSVPSDACLPARIDSVLVTIYLIFTAGYSATSGESLLKKDLCTEAIRLGRLLVSLVPGHGEPAALLALMLFHDSRRNTRTDGAGDIVLLEDQDRSRWNHVAIQEGIELLAAALRNGAAGSRYGIEARIASIHATSARPEDTDWPRVAALYAELKRIAPSPVVELNEAVAIAMAEGPEAGLERLAALEDSGRLDSYHLLPAGQARLLEKIGKRQDAINHYRRALALARNEPERRFLLARLEGASRVPDQGAGVANG